MYVSVVVCTYNRAALLRGALASLAKLRTGDRFRYEIVVVDNGSTDETSRVIQEAAESTAIPLRGMHEAAARRGVCPQLRHPGREGNVDRLL